MPNVRVDSRAIYTTSVPGGAFRGFGAPQAGFVAESQMNKLAVKLGIDPAEIRRRNTLSDGDISITHHPLPLGVTIGQVLDTCAERQQAWAEVPATPDLSPFASLASSGDAVKVGVGLAIGFKNVGFSFGFPERCEATIELYGDEDEYDSAILYHGGADVGQAYLFDATTGDLLYTFDDSTVTSNDNFGLSVD